MTPIELQQRGMEILIRELGYPDAMRFMLQFTRGRGDYTKQRRRLLASVGIEDLLSATAKRLEKAPARRGRKRRPA